MWSRLFPLVSEISLLAFTVFPNPALAQHQTIHCENTPLNGIHNFTLEAIWEQAAEDSEFLLASLTDAAFDPSGNICIVDISQKNLQIFDPLGNWLRTLGREGEGPGEFSDARKIFFDDGRYGVLQAFPAAIVWLNADGSPSSKVTLSGHNPENKTFISVGHAVQAGGDIFGWISQTLYTGDEPEYDSWVARVNPDGTTDSVIYSPPDQPSARVDNGIDEGKVYDIWMWRWACDGQGGVWVAPERDRYVLQHWNAAGEMVLEVDRPYKPVRRNEQGKASIVVWFRRRGWRTEQIHVGKTAPVFSKIRLADDGNLWLRLDLGGSEPDSDLVRIYDVFNPTGEYLKQMRLFSSLDTDGLVMLNDETALILSTDPEKEEQVLSLLKMITAPE